MKKTSQVLADEKIGDIDSYLGYWLRFVSNQVSSSFQARLAKKEITVAEWIALRFLLSHAPCSQTKLADEMGLNKSAISRLIDRLEKTQLIKRHPSPDDRRLIVLELTPTGIKLVPHLAKIADENDDFFFGHLSKKELDFVTNILKNISTKHKFRTKPIN